MNSADGTSITHSHDNEGTPTPLPTNHLPRSVLPAPQTVQWGGGEQAAITNKSIRVNPVLDCTAVSISAAAIH
jgi:hypothetical protein